ncbi:MAG: hypothetical protein GY850_07685, partial [bacterium]|nr:hypothetical protein [bacterium]
MLKLKDIKMKPKLIGLFLIVGIIPLAITGWWSARLATEALMEKSYGQLEAVRGIKKAQIEKYFSERQGDMGVLMDTVATLRQNAFQKMGVVQELKITAIENFFQNLLTNAVMLSRHRKFQDSLVAYDKGFRAAGAQKSDTYKKVVSKYQDFLRQTQKELGLYDIFLITNEGDIIASAAQEADAWTNLKTGPFRDTNLANAWSAAIAKPYAG